MLELQMKVPSWMTFKKELLKLLPEWCSEVPFQVKGNSVKEAYQAFFGTLKASKGRCKATFRFRSRKLLRQTCFIPKSAVRASGVYPRVSGKELHYSEALPEQPCDSRLVWEYGSWWLRVPYKTKQHVPYGENQARVVAIDPGIRKFASYYSDKSCGHIAEKTFSRIQRLCHHLDDLISRTSKVSGQRKQRMRIAAARMRGKVRHLIDELHHKAALFFVKNWDLILLPTFETSQMSMRGKRKLRSQSVRMLLTFAHYRFKQHLINKAEEYGKTVMDVSEAYTSKTHPSTGELVTIGSARRMRLSDSEWIDRDINAARNILLRALVDTPEAFSLAVNNR